VRSSGSWPPPGHRDGERPRGAPRTFRSSRAVSCASRGRTRAPVPRVIRPGRPPRCCTAAVTSRVTSWRGRRDRRTSRDCWPCARARCWRPPCVASPANPMSCSSTRPAGITRCGVGSRSILEPSSDCRPSVSPTDPCSPAGTGPATSTGRPVRYGSTERRLAAGSAPGKGPARSPCMRVGARTPASRRRPCSDAGAAGALPSRCERPAVRLARPARVSSPPLD